MKAAVARSGVLRIEELDDPVPGPGQVLIKPLACGVCGSDVHLLETQAAMPDLVPNMVLGHEFVGEICEFGPDTQRRYPPGTVVTSVPCLDHATGPQLIGVSPLAYGALAERMLLQESRLLPVPQELPTHHAALAEPLAVGTHAVNAARMQPGDVPLVIGCGPVGLAVIAALKAAGHSPVVGASFSVTRRQLGEAAGADLVIDPNQTSPYAAWAQLTGPDAPISLLIDDEIRSRAVVFECVGAPGLLDTIIQSVPARTRVIVVGVCQQPDPITPTVAVMKEISITFSFGYHPREFAQALQWLIDGRFPADRLVTATLPLEEAPEAVAALQGPSKHCKILITPND